MGSAVSSIPATGLFPWPWLLLVGPALASIDLSGCLPVVQGKLANDSSLRNNSFYFAEVPASFDSPVLTLAGCEAWCPGDAAISPQCGSRLFQWVLPAVLLVGALQTPAAAPGRVRLWAMLRPISDLPDTLVSMACVLATYALCFREAGVLLQESDAFPASGLPDQHRRRLARSLAVVLHGLHDLDVSQPARAISELRVALARVLDSAASSYANGRPGRLEKRLHLAAAEIMHNRERQTWQAYGAIFFAVAAIAFAMIPPATPGSPPVSGATISSTLVLAPLVLVVLLSSAIGEHISLYTLRKAAKSFLDDLAKENAIAQVQDASDSNKGIDGDAKPQIEEQVAAVAETAPPPARAISIPEIRDLDGLFYSTGSLYYQPHKFRDGDVWAAGGGGHVLHFLLVALLSVAPVSLAGAAGALAGPPSFFVDRIFLVVAIAFVWAVSPVLTWILVGGRTAVPALRWHVLAAKDLVVATGIVTSLAGITCGMGGDCKMWSGYYRYGAAAARVPLDNTAAFDWNSSVLYPALVSACLGWNLAVYFAVRYAGVPAAIWPRDCAAGRRPFWPAAATTAAMRDALYVLAWKDREIRECLEVE